MLPAEPEGAIDDPLPDELASGGVVPDDVVGGVMVLPDVEGVMLLPDELDDDGDEDMLPDEGGVVGAGVVVVLLGDGVSEGALLQAASDSADSNASANIVGRFIGCSQERVVRSVARSTCPSSSRHMPRQRRVPPRRDLSGALGTRCRNASDGACALCTRRWRKQRAGDDGGRATRP